MAGTPMAITDMQFIKGNLFLPEVVGGNAISFGELQEISVGVATELAKAMGPNQLTAIDMGLQSRTVTGTARHAKVRTPGMKTLLGGSQAYSSPYTTLTVNVDSEPSTPFNVHLKSPSDGTNLELYLYNALCTNYDLSVPARGFLYPNFGFEAIGLNGGLLMKVRITGDQTTSN